MFLQNYRTQHAGLIAVLMLTLGLVSCAKEEFMAKKSQDSFSAPLTFSNNATVCSQFTLIKPRVDFLFLWDNTSSQYLVTDETKQALTNTINYISDRFDFHILMAPLVPQPGSAVNDVAYLITTSIFGLGQSAINIRAEKSQAASLLNNFTVTANANEKGLQRSYDMIYANITNGIFRQDAYTIVVLMSNGNDYKVDTNGYYDPVSTNQYILNIKNQLLNLRNTVLRSTQLRFISLVPHTSQCRVGWLQGGSYTEMSKQLYSAPFPAGDLRKLPYDQTGDSTPDSYDICTSDFLHLFDGVNNSIQDTVISHQYNFWPISAVQSPLTFDPNKLRVQKANGDEFFEVSGPNQGAGWRYAGYLTEQNMRYAPSPGEAFTGHMIELYGNARVTYPECLLITTVSPTYNYGYVALSSKPIESSIRVTIDGRSIPQSDVDGWEYIGAKASQNLRIQGPNFPQDPYQEVLPADIRTNAYFLKMHGSAIYKSGAVVNAVYDPAGN
ncbi:MAG: hypothetical protein A2X86_06525 [Bdellovibrionales bacterium GWA2_49_15]|nr:MAG: hypothetical protein A2X86_06525 [Bdellovibrionales bacterium GWA2_49_15]HAZ12073.1 hypothetical protein [Bdellovibrionales bacterium]